MEILSDFEFFLGVLFLNHLFPVLALFRLGCHLLHTFSVNGSYVNARFT